MSTKTLLKFVVGFGILAIVLIFLGVNFVPRIKAMSSANKNTVDATLLRDLRARQADAARWQAMGAYYSKLSAAVPNFDASLRDLSAARGQALGEADFAVTLRARQADAARWQGLGEAYLAVNLRARQADAARWQAMGAYYSKLSAAVPNFDASLRDLSAARGQALGEADLAVTLRARQADAARWQAMGEYYSKHSTP